MANSRQWMGFGEALMSFGAKMGALQNEKERNEHLAELENKRVQLDNRVASNTDKYQQGLLSNDSARTTADSANKAELARIERERLRIEQEDRQGSRALEGRKVDLAETAQGDNTKLKAYELSIQELATRAGDKNTQQKLLLDAAQLGIKRTDDGNWVDDKGVLDARKARELEAAWKAPETKLKMFDSGAIKLGSQVVENTPLMDARSKRAIAVEEAKAKSTAAIWAAKTSATGGGSPSANVQMLAQIRSAVDHNPATANKPESERQRLALDGLARLMAQSRPELARLKVLTAKLAQVYPPLTDDERQQTQAEIDMLNTRLNSGVFGGGGGGGTGDTDNLPKGGAWDRTAQ